MNNNIELAVRGVGFGSEFIGTAFAKSGYGKKKLKWDKLDNKFIDSSPKNLGYLLITYFK